MNPIENNRPSIFDYEDYRIYLKDHFEYLKKINPKFSFRLFSRLAGLKSSNALQRVISGARGIDTKTLQRFSKPMGLCLDEIEYLDCLIRITREKTDQVREQLLLKMENLKRYRSQRLLFRDHLEYYSNWYHAAIRELAGLEPLEDNPRQLAQRLIPSISEKEAQESLNLLKNLGVLIKGDDGRFYPTTNVVTTGPEVRNLGVANFLSQMMLNGIQAITAFPSADREISSVTISVGESEFKKLKARIAAFRREILLNLPARKGSADRVVQVNFQLFPLVNKKK